MADGEIPKSDWLKFKIKKIKTTNDPTVIG